ncbi:hypothetical protein EJP02_216 [Escherichia phage EJP2]|nr:hypothetical protein EJP02_216 [Escherichia phage EJP2]
MTRDEIIQMILTERNRQTENPNTVSDLHKTKNDWAALAAYYLFEGASRSDKHVSFEEFRSSLVQTAAVIIAALETSYAHENETVRDLLSQLENKDDKQ